MILECLKGHRFSSLPSKTSNLSLKLPIVSKCPCSWSYQVFLILTNDSCWLSLTVSCYDRSSLFLSWFPVLRPLSVHVSCTSILIDLLYDFQISSDLHRNSSLDASLISHWVESNRKVYWFTLFQSIENCCSNRKYLSFAGICKLF